MPRSSRMVTLDSDVFKCCHRVETLGWRDDSIAKKLLQRAADQVKPIMARRKWAVPMLTEFYPPMPNLLGMNHNHGERIEIRLRSPGNRDSFLEYESVLGTLLHELVHIEVGPHNAEFYKLLDELQDECDALQMSSGMGTGGYGGGNRLGGGNGGVVSKNAARKRAAESAARRRHAGKLMPTGGRVLGGDAQLTQIAALCDPREMALAAAQRRLADDVWCSSVHNTSNPGTSASRPPPPVIIDVDAGNDEIVAIKDDEDDDKHQDIKKNSDQIHGPRRTPLATRDNADRVPARDSPAAAAALRRAGGYPARGQRAGGNASHVPLRGSPAALAALQRAETSARPRRR